MKNTFAKFITFILIGIIASFNAEAQTAEKKSAGNKDFDVSKADTLLDFSKFNWKDNTNQKSPSGKSVTIGDKKDGGIVYWVDATGKHGLIAYAKDLGIIKWDAANEACKNLGAGWRLPTKDELNKLYEAKQLAILASYFMFQSSTEVDQYNVWAQSLSNGKQSTGGKNHPASTCAVRSF